MFCFMYRLTGLFFIFTAFSKTRNFYQLEEVFFIPWFPGICDGISQLGNNIF